jgi:peroxiredoxin Q/BCP
MAQLRQEFDQFVEQDAVIVVTGPEDAGDFARHWQQQKYPFVGLPDPTHKVAELYGQRVKLLKGGRLPALLVIDKMGVIVHVHYSGSMRDIPSNDEVLAVLRRLNGPKE